MSARHAFDHVWFYYWVKLGETCAPWPYLRYSAQCDLYRRLTKGSG